MLLEDIDLETSNKRVKITVKCDQCDIIFSRGIGNVIQGRQRHGRDLCKRCVTVNYNKSRPLEVRQHCGQAVKDKYKGKKLEEIVGIERGATIRKLLSSQRMGEKNHNYQGRHQKFPIRTGTLEAQFGKEKAENIKHKISIATAGSNNPMYGKPTPKKAGCGISGHFRQYYFRSLMELSVILDMLKNQIKFEPCDGCKKFQFSYLFKNAPRTYYPDFYLPETDEFIEVKPARQITGQVILLKAAAVKGANCNFRFITENEVPRIKKEQLMRLIRDKEVQIDENKLKRVNDFEGEKSPSS